MCVCMCVCVHACVCVCFIIIIIILKIIFNVFKCFVYQFNVINNHAFYKMAISDYFGMKWQMYYGTI